MTDSAPLPIRILVKGPSLNHAMSERPQRRGQMFWPRVTEARLLRAGYGVAVHNMAVASQELPTAFGSWEADVKAWSPDVVVINYGYYECVHLIAPRWLERHANSLKARPTGLGPRYRQWVLRPIWKQIANIQQRLDKIIGPRGFGREVRRFERNLTTYIERTIGVSEPLIMLFEFQIPGTRGRAWFPGMEARAEMMNAAQRRVIAHFDRPDVMLLPVRDILEAAFPGEETNADGFHYTAEAHRVLGEEVAEVIKGWVADQPLFLPEGRSAESRVSGS